MSFNIALTGLTAVNEQLNTVSNNIANTGTTGFKSSRVDFGSLYADTQAMGVEVLGTTQNISQSGSVNRTGRNLDLAISGGGFFVTRATSGEMNYTRAGVFGTDNQNFIVNNLGSRLQGYTVDANGNIQAGTVTDLKLQSANLPARATDALEFGANLDANGAVPAVGAFSPDDPASYNSTYTTQVYDSLGREHALTQYFVKTGDNAWQVHYYMDGAQLTDGSGAAVTHDLSFGGQGILQSGQALNLSIDGVAGAEDLNITLDYTSTTQYGTDFAVHTNRASGYAAGERTGLVVEDDGRLFATYSNGERMLQGQVVLANFTNPEGLKNISGTAWQTTSASGEPLLGIPGGGQFGSLSAGSLEASNVDLTEQLVGLMEGQRNYQANTTVLSTQKELTQVLFNAI